jgi:WD40 repeat protein
MGHQVVCRIRVDEPGRKLEFTWSVGSSAFPPYRLRDDLFERFADRTRAARDQLYRLVTFYLPAAEDRDLPGLRECCFLMAQAGRDLYNLILAPSAEPKGGTREVRRWLREVTETDGVASLEVVSEDQPWFAPWNIVYDSDPDEGLFLKADPRADGGSDVPAAALRPFWGIRYNLCGGLQVEPLRRKRLPGRPDVLIVIDPVVRDGLACHVEAGVSQQAKLLEFIAACQAAEARVVTSREQLQKALKKRPHLIYWLGHAEPDRFKLGDEYVTLGDLGNFLLEVGEDEPAPPGGLVFLNACQTAGSSGRGLGSFLKAFHDADFSGIIATEERTLDNLACPFGIEAMTAFLDRKEPIGEVLRRLRARYAPLGLLYGTYCPPDLQIRTEAAPAAIDPIGEVRHGAAAGLPLGGGGGRGGLGVAERPVDRRAGGRGREEGPPLPDRPYLPLESYGPEHRALFAGREEDIERFARVLGRSDTRVLVLHGESGAGKSSFLNAGVIPFLDDAAVGFLFRGGDDGDGRAGAARGGVMFVRSTEDPAGQIAEALVAFAARPFRFTTPADVEKTVDLASVLADALGVEGAVTQPQARAALLADPGRLGRALEGLSVALPFTLVLMIDQAEEMFTLVRPEGSGLADRDRVLQMLSRIGEGRGDYKVIVALRTEFYGRLIGALRRGPAGAIGVRDYLLTDLDREGLVAFVARPTVDRAIDHAGEVPRDRYHFHYADGVPEAIAAELLRAGRKDGVLPLAQVICTQLWERVQARDPGGRDRVVTADDLGALGGFDGALKRHVEDQIATILPARAPGGAWLVRTAQALLPERLWTRETFQRLMADLTLSQVDGTLTTALVSERKLAEGYARLASPSFGEILAGARDRRLLRTTTRRGDDGAEERSVSLGHDALARVAAPWKQELARRRRLVRLRLLAAVGLSLTVLFAVLAFQLAVQRRELKGALVDAHNKAELARENSLAADRARQDADEKRRLAELRLYDSDMVRLQTAWNMNDCRPLEEILDAHGSSRTAGEDLRGFEWYFWDSLFRGRSRIIKGHAGAVLGVAFSGDGRRIASASSDKKVRVWDAGGRLIMDLEGHEGPVKGVAFDRDGRRIASASGDRKVRVWDLVTKGALVLEGHTGAVNRAVFSPDGRLIASASDDRAVRLWDAATGRPVQVMSGHSGPVNDVAFSGDGHLVASASDDMTARIWDASSGKFLQKLEEHTASIRSVAFYANAGWVATASDDRTLRKWDIATGRRIGGENLPAEVGALAFSRDGSRIAAGALSVFLWDAITGQALWETKGHAGPVRGVALSDDGRFVASASDDRTVRVWDADTGQQPLDLRRHTGPARCVAFSRDGRLITTASDDRTVQVCDAASGQRVRKLEGHDEWVTGVAFSGDGHRIVSASGDGSVRLWDASSGGPMMELKGPAEWVTAVAYSGDGRWIASASYGGKVRLWDAATGRLERELADHAGPVRAVAFSADGRRVASASEDCKVRVWDASSGQTERVLEGHTTPVLGVAFSDDGRLIASASVDHTVRLWDAGSGEPTWVLRGHTGRVHGVAFSGDGRRVASASDDETMRVWDTVTGQQVLLLYFPGMGGQGAPCGVAFSTDGRRIALAGYSGTVRVWDTTAVMPSLDAPAVAPGAIGPVKVDLLPALEVGDPAPDFTARRLDGGRFRPKDRRGKLVLLHFWSAGPPAFSSDMPALQDLYKTYRGDPRFELVCLAGDPEIEAPRRYAVENKLGGTQAFAPGVAGTYLVRAFPATYLIGPDGRILARGFNRAVTERAVHDALGNDKLFADSKAAARAPRFTVTRFDPGSPEPAPSDAPAVVVLDNCDPDFMEARPHRDGLRFLTDSGRELRSIKEFNTRGDWWGAGNMVAVDGTRGRIYFGENVNDRVTALDLRGRKLWQVRKIKGDAFAVDPKTGHLWCSSVSNLASGETVVLDGDGREVDSFPFWGVDIVHDPHTDGFWLVGHEITKLSREGEVLFHKPLEGRACASVAVNPKDGSVWIAERAHPQFPQSGPRLWHLDAQGREIWSRVLTNKDPFAVACDPRTGSAFVVNPTSEILHFAADGVELPTLPVPAVAVAVSPTTGQLWVTTQREILRLDQSGAILSSSPFGAFSSQSRLAAF